MDYHTHNNQNNQTWFLGGSIIFAGIIIAVAVLYAGNIFNPIGNNKQDTETQNQIASDEETKEILTVRQDDYVWGNPDASVKLFLFSDTECPYCKQYHMTLQTIMKTYKDSGKLAVVFRHFPLSIHPRAYKRLKP
jgi:protein-disulfide isomerase